MSKLILFGPDGMVGNYIKSYIPNTIDIPRKQCDINKITINELKNIISKYGNNNIIINCAGIIPQTIQKHTESEYYKVNSIFPIILSLVCESLNCRMIHISTDCVFSGNDGKYAENSQHDSKSIYGISKSLGELCNATIIRTSVIGEETKNKKSLLEWVKSNKNREIDGYTNQFWNGITCLELAKIIKHIIDNNLYWDGVRNIYSPRVISKCDLISIINKEYDLNITLNNIKLPKTIDKSLTSDVILFKIKSIEAQIKELSSFKILKNNY